MAALDLLGTRWTLRILWELRDGPIGARALIGRCGGLSSSVLYQRLRQLSDAGLIVRGETGSYQLTPSGHSLRVAIEPLDGWAKQWSARDRSGGT